MVRLGHSSTSAALICQHATRDRDQAIATALGDLARQVRTPWTLARKSRARTRDRTPVWHMCGTPMIVEPSRAESLPGCPGFDLGFLVGAGDGNRTRMASLEGVPQHAVMGADQPIVMTGGGRY
jgi:hypothetical protein